MTKKGNGTRPERLMCKEFSLSSRLGFKLLVLKQSLPPVLPAKA